MLCRQLRQGPDRGVGSVPTSPVGFPYYIMRGGQLGWGGGQQTFPTMADAMILSKLYNVATWLARTRVAESRLIVQYKQEDYYQNKGSA